MSSLLDSLNPSQRDAVVYNEGPHLVIAGAGSGKTRVLTYKIAYLLEQGVSASAILALTFTNKAAREMRERIAHLVDPHLTRYLAMGTFHSVFARVLRQEADQLGYTKDFTIYDTTDSKSLIKQIIKELNLDEKIYKQSGVLGYISEAKNNLMSPRDYQDSREYQLRDKFNRMYDLGQVYQVYQARLRQANAMDFDDLLFNMNVLLEQFPATCRKYQELFQYILVDEYQDTNYSQYCIIKRLAEPQRHICVVGDDAQSIYSFRGADIRNILQFQDEYHAPVFKLERNYRSTQTIVNAANSLIGHNRHQIHKDVYSENSVGEPIEISSHGNDRDEGKFLAQKIAMLHSTEHRPYDEMAILYRTNAQSRVIEDELRRLSIPYRIYGGVSFYQRKEIKDVLSYFRLIVNPCDNEAFARIVNFPARGIGETTLKRMQLLSAERQISLFEIACQPDEQGLQAQGPTKKKLQQFAQRIISFQDEYDNRDAYEYADWIIKETGIRTALALDKTQEGIDRAENVDELLGAIHEFVQLQDERIQQDPELYTAEDKSIAAFLSEVSLLTDQDEHQDDQTSRVTLMTIHAAKGLEYGVIMIAGLEENLFPSGFCENEKELEEERRLFYVAITRAKDECYITNAKSRFKNGQVQFQTPSRFLKEIDGQYVRRIENENYPTTNHWGRFGFNDDDDFRESGFRTFSGNNGGHGRAQNTFSDGPDAFTPVAKPAPRNLKPTTGMHMKQEKQTIDSPFPVGCRIHHDIFGDGTVREAFTDGGTDNEKIIIDFDTKGQKTLLLKYVAGKLKRI